MKRFTVASLSAGFLLLAAIPASAAGPPPLDPQHVSSYEHAYNTAAHEFGLRAVGCKLIAPKATCHQRVTDGALVVSLGVLERMLAPPSQATPAPTASSYSQTVPESSAAGSSATTTTGGGGYSIPSSIVQCESGGNWSAVNPSSGAGGAYQILPSTWAAYGGTGAPQDAPPSVQSAIAARIYAAGGASQWTCG